MVRRPKLYRRLMVVACLGYGALSATSAQALPSYARQTGQECTACHTNFPELTQFGREFKLRGYTMDGGDSPFPLAAMVQVPHQHPEIAAGWCRAHFGPNDNFSLAAAGLFYGGEIVDSFGAFIQATYRTPRALSWDNVDIRYSNSTSNGNRDLVYGITLNNNPTVRTSTTARGLLRFLCPASSRPRPAAETYRGWARSAGRRRRRLRKIRRDLLRPFQPVQNTAEARPAPFRRRPDGEGGDRRGRALLAPCRRAAMAGPPFIGWNVRPLCGYLPGARTSRGRQFVRRCGLDAQYQFVLDPNVVTAQVSWIHEDQFLPASQALGLSEHRSNSLNSVKLTTSYVYSHGASSYGVTASRFWLNGSRTRGSTVRRT